MEHDIKNLSYDDLKLLYETFQIVRSGEYEGSDV